MAFATFYRYEFTDFPPVGYGLSQWLWRVSFLRDGYSGSIVAILPGENPLTIEIDKQGDSRFAGAMAEKYNFELICDNQLQASQLYVESDDEVQILIECDQTNTGDHYTVYSRGWLLASEIKEPYEPKPYPVTVSGICGLARLSTRPFLDQSGKRLQGFVSLSHAIRLCLYWAGHSTNLIAAFNLYELGDMAVGQTVDGHADPTRCPLYQTMIRAEWFVTSTGTPRMCDEVLKGILGPVMRLEQLTSGDWLLLRADEGAGNWDPTNTTTKDTVRVRHYTSSTLPDPPDTGGSSSINLNVYTDTLGELMVEHGTKAYTWKAVTKPGVRVEQAFGDWLNKLPNSDMATVDTTGLPTGWATSMNADVPSGITPGKSIHDRFRVGDGTNNGQDTEYAIRINGINGPFIDSTINLVSLTVEFDLSSKDYTLYQSRQLSGQFMVSGTRGAKMFAQIECGDASQFNKVVYYQVQGGSIRYDEAKSSDMVGVTFDHFYTDSLGVQHSKVGYADFTFDLGTYNHVRKIIIFLCAGLSLTNTDGSPFVGPPLPYIKYRRLKMTTKPQDLILDGQQKTFTKSGKIAPDTNAGLTLGDVPDAASPYDRLGTLYNRGLTDSPNATSKWFWPDANVLATSPAGHDIGYPWIDWVARTFARQIMTPSDMVSGNFIGRLPYKAQTTIHLFDVGETVSSTFVTYPHQITRWTYNVRDCSNEITAQRIPGETDLSTYDRKAEWKSGDTLIPMSEDQDGNPAEPVWVHHLTEKEQFFKNLFDAGSRPNLKLIAGKRGYTSAPDVTNQALLQLVASSGGVVKGAVKSSFVLNPGLAALL